MNTLSLVIYGLEAATTVINIALIEMKDGSPIKTILQEVLQAIEGAMGGLEQHTDQVKAYREQKEAAEAHIKAEASAPKADEKSDPQPDADPNEAARDFQAPKPDADPEGN